MKLQDFLGKNTRYDIKGISEDDELSRQVQTRLIDLGLLDPPVDGVFARNQRRDYTNFRS